MGKNQRAKAKNASEKRNTSKNKNNNVFKVAGSKAFKCKNKAKAVTSKLKQLKDGNQKKTAQVDKQLVNLKEQLLQKSAPTAAEPKKIAKEDPKPSIAPASLEATSSFSVMQM